MDILCVVAVIYAIGTVIFWIYCNIIFDTGDNRREIKFADSVIVVMSILWPLVIIVLSYDKMMEKKK